MILGLLAVGGILLATLGFRQLLAALVEIVSRGDGSEIREAIQGYGLWAPVVSVALVLLHMIIPFPAELMALANGLAFGFWGGLVLTWSGFMLSAILMYGAGRLWGRPLLERVVPHRHRERLDDWLEHEGAFPLLAVRLVPLVPFNTVCLAAGVIRAPLRTYVWTTGAGILPLGIMLTLFGSRFGESTFRMDVTFWAPNVVFLVIVLTTWWTFRYRNARTG